MDVKLAVSPGEPPLSIILFIDVATRAANYEQACNTDAL